MIHYIEFTEAMKYKKCAVTVRSDGRYSCRVLTHYIVGSDGKKHYRYKDIYGVDENDVYIKRAEFIDAQINKATQQAITDGLMTTKLNEWLYVHKYRKIRGNSFDRVECTLIHQITTPMEQLGLSNLLLRDVTTLHIERIMQYNLERGLSYSTLKKAHNLLKEFFDYFEDEIPKNPMRKYEFYSKNAVIEAQKSLQPAKDAAVAKIAQWKQETRHNRHSDICITEEDRRLANLKLHSQIDERDIHYFSDDEIERIKYVITNGYRIEHLSRSDNMVKSGLYYPKQGKFFLFLMYSGLRCGEAISLRYSDFNYEECTVSVTQNTTYTKERDASGQATGARKKTIGNLKTEGSRAIIALSQYAIQIIQEMQAEEPEGYDGYVVNNNGKAISSKTLWLRFSKLLRGAGIDICGTHSLRHTCATQIYQHSFGNAKLVAQQLRHKDSSFTTKTYVHQDDARTREIIGDMKI